LKADQQACRIREIQKRTRRVEAAGLRPSPAV